MTCGGAPPDDQDVMPVKEAQLFSFDQFFPNYGCLLSSSRNLLLLFGVVFLALSVTKNVLLPETVFPFGMRTSDVTNLPFVTFMLAVAMPLGYQLMSNTEYELQTSAVVIGGVVMAYMTLEENVIPTILPATGWFSKAPSLSSVSPTSALPSFDSFFRSRSV
mgnify:CR=1 FL=1